MLCLLLCYKRSFVCNVMQISKNPSAPTKATSGRQDYSPGLLQIKSTRSKSGKVKSKRQREVMVAIGGDNGRVVTGGIGVESG